MTRLLKNLRTVVFPAIIIVAAFIIAATAGVFSAAPERSETVTVTIEHGMGAGSISMMLEERGLINSARWFKLYSRLYGLSASFKAGDHSLEPGLSTTEIARLLTEIPPLPPDLRITIIEGLTIDETAASLAAQTGIDSSAIAVLTHDKDFAKTLGVDKATLEGYLYPDTYFIRPESSAKELLKRMTRQFHAVFVDSLKVRAEEMGMMVDEVVTLASIIEQEVNLDEERPLVSSVFHRRLKRKRPLEANPTIQYALGEKRRVLYEDLELDSPYNTYKYAGLPPGPIASPGRKSILAALYPADTKYLYFVSDTKGGHVFSRNITEHNRAVRKYRKLMRNARLRK